MRDNFLRSWLAALASAVAATNFQPTERLIAQALLRLEEAEGHLASDPASLQATGSSNFRIETTIACIQSIDLL